MRYRSLTSVALGLGVVLLLDVLRVWLPGIITIFGQAASTPAELMAAFALGWFVLALAAPPLVRRLGARPVTVAAAVLLAAARLALTAAPGGRPQLYLATAGLVAGLVWLAGTASTTDRPVPGLALGLALGAVGHAALDTYDLVWRAGAGPWLASGALVVLFLAGQSLPAAPDGGGGARAWLLAGPATLLAAQVALSPALARTAVSYGVGAGGVAVPPPAGLVALTVAVTVGGFLLAALAVPARWAGRVVAPAALLTGAVLFALDRGDLLAPAMVLTAVGLGGCLALTGEAGAGPGSANGPAPAARRAYAAVAGMLVLAVAAVAYYSAYDLGYPNGWVPVVVAAPLAVVALRTGRPGRPAVAPLPARWTALGLSAVALVAVVGQDRGPAAGSDRGGPSADVDLVAYNVRMGFGLDGRFDLDGLTRALTGARPGHRPDVVVLGEVDRAWLLNGGHDVLHLLAERLDLPYVFAPAADPVWGDAVLSRFPVTDARTRALPAVGAPTGAQALAVTLDLGGDARLVVVGTHLQPPPGRQPVVQARTVAEFATRYAAGRPLVVAGDLNTEPGDPAFTEFTRAGLVDALAAARPLPTSPADDPREQIDHVLVSPGIVPAGPVAPRSVASDHLPVAVTLTLSPAPAR